MNAMGLRPKLKFFSSPRRSVRWYIDNDLDAADIVFFRARRSHCVHVSRVHSWPSDATAAEVLLWGSTEVGLCGANGSTTDRVGTFADADLCTWCVRAFGDESVRLFAGRAEP